MLHVVGFSARDPLPELDPGGCCRQLSALMPQHTWLILGQAYQDGVEQLEALVLGQGLQSLGNLGDIRGGGALVDNLNLDSHIIVGQGARVPRVLVERTRSRNDEQVGSGVVRGRCGLGVERSVESAVDKRREVVLWLCRPRVSDLEGGLDAAEQQEVNHAVWGRDGDGAE